MDGRCPLKLEDLPDTWCALAVQRLKAIRNAGRELTEEEEAALPGCPWTINSQTANYCFFSYVSTLLPSEPVSEAEIAGLLDIETETVKKLEKSALSKVRDSAIFKSIKEMHGESQIIEDRDGDFKIVE